jgi:hypothetical protein
MLLTKRCHEDYSEFVAGSQAEGWSVSWDIPSISGLAGATLALLTILGKFLGGLGWLRKKIAAARAGSAALVEIPARTLILVPACTPSACRWSLDRFGGRVAMRVICEVKATNVCKYAVALLRAGMQKPSVTGCVRVQADSGGDASTVIPSLALRDLRLEFVIEPPIVSGLESFEADVAVVDQFGNEHWLRDVRFEHLAWDRVLCKAS